MLMIRLMKVYAYKGKNIFTVQFHPEACAGPQDTAYLFDRFMDMMKKED